MPSWTPPASHCARAVLRQRRSAARRHSPFGAGLGEEGPVPGDGTHDGNEPDPFRPGAADQPEARRDRVHGGGSADQRGRGRRFLGAYIVGRVGFEPTTKGL